MKNSTDTLYTRALTEEDTETVFMLDEKSGNCVSEWLKGNTDFAWGFFKEDQLIGYCTTGYADDCPFSIEDHPLHTCDSILLSNVFILPEFRHHGYGSKMVTNAILNRWESDRVQNAVFLTVMYDDLVSFYQKIGFQVILPYEGDMFLWPENIFGGNYKIMGSFSWLRADKATKRSNLVKGDKYKILIPAEFGGGYIIDTYYNYGNVFEYDSTRPNADLYGILAYWNKCEGMQYEGDTYPATIQEILERGDTCSYNNRSKGIYIGCCKKNIDKLKYPLKLVSFSFKGTYEDCEGRSYNDPNQGLLKTYWK